MRALFACSTAKTDIRKEYATIYMRRLIYPNRYSWQRKKRERKKNNIIFEER